MDDNFDDESTLLRVKMALAVERIVRREINMLNNDGSDFVVPSSTMYSISEMITQYTTQVLSKDLYYFAKHAKRTTITMNDVLLCARKSESIKEKMTDFCQAIKDKKKASTKKKKRKASALADKSNQVLSDLD